MSFSKVIFSSLLLFFSSVSVAESIIEREGRFEFYWSTGKIRFYGTSLNKLDDGETWRASEQFAWGDGLAYGESKLGPLLSERSGISTVKAPSKLSLLSATKSLNTTYFGDSRVKVALEAPMSAALGQIIDGSGGNVISSASEGVLLINVAAPASPSAFVSVVDESGNELLSAKDMAATTVTGGKLPKWFKKQAPPQESKGLGTPVATILATAPSRGVLKVAKSDWRPEYAGMIAHGNASIILK